MAFYDKNGTEIKQNDHIVPDKGYELVIISEAYVEDYGQVCLFGQQVVNPLAFSILTQDNLSLQWTKKES